MAGKLLFIDDEEIVLRSCRRIFAKEDFQIDTALSGEEGLAKAREGDYDVVVTDLKMPGIGDGSSPDPPEGAAGRSSSSSPATPTWRRPGRL